MLFIILALVIIMHVLCALYDFTFYRIPNLFLGIMLVLYAFYAPLYLSLHTIMNSLILFGAILILSFGLYAFKVIGAGDAKYISVASLWAGLHGIVPLLFLISFAGAALAIIYLVFKDHIGRVSDRMWQIIQKLEASCPQCQKVWVGSGIGPEMGKRENIESRMIPYGVAIAVGSIIMLIINPVTH